MLWIAALALLVAGRLDADVPGAGTTITAENMETYAEVLFPTTEYFLRHGMTIEVVPYRDAHVEDQTGLLGSVTDRMHHWNPVATFLATGYFMSSRLRPLLAAAYDVNDEFPVFWVQAEWFHDERWSVKVGEVIYAGSRYAESFLFLNRYGDRDTFFVQVSYWLL